MIDFTKKDLDQLKEKGISKEKVLQQVETFKEGIPFVTLEKAAVVGDGIVRANDVEQKELISYYERLISFLFIMYY